MTALLYTVPGIRLGLKDGSRWSADDKAKKTKILDSRQAPVDTIRPPCYCPANSQIDICKHGAVMQSLASLYSKSVFFV